jgi:hypothetical protein
VTAEAGATATEDLRDMFAQMSAWIHELNEHVGEAQVLLMPLFVDHDAHLTIGRDD